ncbi:hypothetical protein I215_12333 [Galbibacter marinus]|uniref:SHOCT domain-containing protein n=1 Tax=Galbibacter marinus TaxID=555500 RepID=K2QI65_9FLAO|nr:hypothetical protein [Galbibacter marinus]EKF54417.1 hypothetical protein I215_12333 [Galbibacter marinus]
MKEIVVTFIVGLATWSTIYVWTSGRYTLPQKIYLTFCVLFVPLQWISIIIIYFYNSSRISYPANNTQKFKRVFSTSEQEMSLLVLKQKGILTNEEYHEKLEIIEQNSNILKTNLVKEKVKSLDEYKHLHNLLRVSLLSQEQFEKKVYLLIKDYESYMSIYGNNLYPKHTWTLYQKYKQHLAVEKSNYSYLDFYGAWKFKNYIIYFNNENEVKFIFDKSTAIVGTYMLENKKIHIKTRKERYTLNIEDVGSHILSYINSEGNRFTGYRL